MIEPFPTEPYPARAAARAGSAAVIEPVTHAARMRQGYAVTACGLILRYPLYKDPRAPFTCRNCARRLGAAPEPDPAA